LAVVAVAAVVAALVPVKLHSEQAAEQAPMLKHCCRQDSLVLQLPLVPPELLAPVAVDQEGMAEPQVSARWYLRSAEPAAAGNLLPSARFRYLRPALPADPLRPVPTSSLEKAETVYWALADQRPASLVVVVVHQDLGRGQAAARVAALEPARESRRRLLAEVAGAPSIFLAPAR
jgi:hypothetical protein